MTNPIEAKASELIKGELAPLVARFADAGASAYLVGGWVRDAFLGRGREELDIDIATGARPDETERIVKGLGPIWLQGRDFGTIGVQLDGRRIEITTFRAEVYPEDSRKPSVEFGETIDDDLARRDFTINAMAIDVADLSFEDPFGGLQDLLDRRLRTPLEPEVAFAEDPLRMLRAARFVSQLGFDLDADAIEAMTSMHDRLSIISAERVRDELSKLLVGDHVSAALWLLVESGLTDEFLPELPALQLEQDPVNRHKDVLAHTIAVTEKASPHLRVRLAALLHDIGKPKTRSYAGGKVSFHHHEAVGARMARERMVALRFPSNFIDEVAELIFLHLRFHTYSMGWTDRAVRRYVRDAGDLLEDLNELVRCDCTTRNARKAAALDQRMEELEDRIRELSEKEELARIRPPLDGRQVMDHLGIAPGRIVGDALDHLLELRLDEGPIDEAEAYQLLDEWAADKGITRASGP